MKLSLVREGIMVSRSRRDDSKRFHPRQQVRLLAAYFGVCFGTWVF
jgi:hypothetical protein